MGSAANGHSIAIDASGQLSFALEHHGRNGGRGPAGVRRANGLAPSGAAAQRGGAAPRVCLVSQRGITRQLSRCCGYEFEDVIAAVDGVRMVAPTPTRTSALRLKIRNRIPPGVGPLVPTGLLVERDFAAFDLFFMVVQFVRDLASYDAVRDYRRRSRVAICMLEEVWANAIDLSRGQLAALREFDHVFVSCAASVAPLSEAIGRPVEYMPPGVDALTFAPDFDADTRPIDVMNIGRRSPVTHAALLDHARTRRGFYLHDTLQGPFAARVPAEHRLLLANQIRHSRYFIANMAKKDRAHETSDQPEIGFRYFEGLAGGAVLLGDHPRTREFATHLGWQDSVIPIPFDCAHIGEVIDELDRDPVRLARVRRRNVANIAQRHDWLHRWRTVLTRAGLPETAEMEARGRDIDHLARAAAATPPVPV
ncbi:MAG: glycosyltransferase [Acuticoccus sp.]